MSFVQKFIEIQKEYKIDGMRFEEDILDIFATRNQETRRCTLDHGIFDERKMKIFEDWVDENSEWLKNRN